MKKFVCGPVTTRIGTKIFLVDVTASLHHMSIFSTLGNADKHAFEGTISKIWRGSLKHILTCSNTILTGSRNILTGSNTILTALVQF